MAAPCVTAARTAVQGLHLVPVRWLLSRGHQPQVMCQFLRLQAARCRPLHVSPASMCVSRTESQKSTQPPNPAGTGSQTQDKTNKAEEEEEEEEGPEYIPRTKAKNPMRKIGYAWMIGLPSGIIGFLLAKRQVDKNRLKQLKIRQRMKQSNEGEYEGSRYLHHHHKESVKVDQS